MLLKGENGRTLIETHLKKEGFKICVAECYKRVLRNFNKYKETKKWRSQNINTLVVTSGESLYQLKRIASEIDQAEWLLQCKIFVVGSRLFDIAYNLGWQDIIISQYANNEYLLKVINCEYLNH